MTELSKILCPHCGGHVHTMAHIARQQAPQLDPQASKNSNACPNCQQWKKPGFDLCYNCSMATMDDCPVEGCKRKKKPNFETCFQCKQEGRSAPKPAPNPPPPSRPADPDPYDDGYPDADMGEEYETF